MIKLLDHGYIRLVEAWGRGDAGVDFGDYECGIIEAARQSTQGSFRGWDRDSRLLEYMWTHRHVSPFEFAGLVIEVQAPIFVFREWHRHRTQSYNEMSARYAPLPDLYYVPTVERLFNVQNGNKQAEKDTHGNDLSLENAHDFIGRLERHCQESELLYSFALKNGVPKELARVGMPVGHYSRMRASANLRNWLAFLTLRMDPNAQWEIWQYANALGREIIAKVFPRTWELFEPTTGKEARE